MNRIQKTFERCGHEGRTAYVAYLTMGAPTLEASFAAAETLISRAANASPPPSPAGNQTAVAADGQCAVAIVWDRTARDWARSTFWTTMPCGTSS